MLAEKRRALCVEDDPHICEVITFFLRDFEVISASTGRAALDHLAAAKFSIVLLDYHLPDLSGDEICKIIRSRDTVTPIILFTADDESDGKRADAAGVADTIYKAGADFFARLVASAEMHTLPAQPEPLTGVS